jgi:hypothetical protein
MQRRMDNSKASSVYVSKQATTTISRDNKRTEGKAKCFQERKQHTRLFFMFGRPAVTSPCVCVCVCVCVLRKAVRIAAERLAMEEALKRRPWSPCRRAQALLQLTMTRAPSQRQLCVVSIPGSLPHLRARPTCSQLCSS